VDTIVGAVIGIAVLFFTMTGGFAMASAYGARTQLAEITAEVSREMAADGGFTYQVQQDTIHYLSASGFDPSKALVQVTPGSWDPYGQTYSVEIQYPVPITIAEVTPFSVVVSSTQAGVSLYPCTSSCPNPPSVESPPGQGTGDLGGSP